MKQTTMFYDEIKIARKLLKADYALCLAIMTIELGSKSRAILRLRWMYYDYYFSIKRHNDMIAL